MFLLLAEHQLGRPRASKGDPKILIRRVKSCLNNVSAYQTPLMHTDTSVDRLKSRIAFLEFRVHHPELISKSVILSPPLSTSDMPGFVCMTRLHIAFINWKKTEKTSLSKIIT